MSADVIHARYDELATIARRFGQQAAAIHDLRNQLQRAAQPLEQGGWQGRGSAMFVREMTTQVLPATQRLRLALDEARAVTLEISALLQQAEQEAAAPFRGQVAAAAPGIGAALSDLRDRIMALDPELGIKLDLLIGFGEGLVDSARGVADVAKYIFWVSAPLAELIDPQRAAATRQQTVDVLAAIWNDPPAALSAMWQGLSAPYVEDWTAGRPGQAIGRGVFDVGSLFVGVGEVAAVVKGLGTAGRAGKVLDTAADAGRALDAVADGARAADAAADSAHAVDAVADAARPLPSAAAGARALDDAGDAARTVAALAAKYGDPGRRIVSEFGEKLGGKILRNYDFITDVDGADGLMKDLLAGAPTSPTRKGAHAEVAYAAYLRTHGEQLERLGDVINGKKAGDILITEDRIIDVKNYN